MLKIQGLNPNTLLTDFISISEFARSLTPQEALMVFLRLQGDTQEKLAEFWGTSRPYISYRFRGIREKFKQAWIP